MVCGESIEVVERRLRWCTWNFSYWCGWTNDWCRGWFGIRYPCRFRSRYCDGSLDYPCYTNTVVTKYCYDFSSFSNNCTIFYERHEGCCGGREFSWSDGCLGWVSGYLSGRKCFDEPLEDKGTCREGHSIPRGGNLPGGSFDPGSVSPQPGITNVTTGNLSSKNITKTTENKKNNSIVSDKNKQKMALQFLGLFLMKLGVCPMCMKLSFLIAVVVTGLYYTSLISFNMISSLVFPFLIIFDTLAVAHIVTFLIRMQMGRLTVKDCNCKGNVIHYPNTV